MSDPHSQLRNDAQLPSASLGKRRDQPFTYTPSLLEAIAIVAGRDWSEQRQWVTLGALRFTSLCPVTGQPDWASITINYQPRGHLVESKSLKEYLTSFRMHGDFHEDVCRIICDDLVQLLKPVYMEVCGDFDARGSIAIWPYVQWADPQDPSACALRDTRLAHYRPGCYSAPSHMR